MGNLWQTTVQFPTAVNITVYVILVALAFLGLYFIGVRGKAAGFTMRWTTQDILVLAIMGVLLEVYDNLIGDQFVSPVIKALTGPLTLLFTILRLMTCPTCSCSWLALHSSANPSSPPPSSFSTSC